MVGLLRDVYGIPSRVVGGYRGKNHLGGKDGKSYLVIPGEAHAWVEVFHDGQWHLFDPTPVNKDRKTTDDSGGDANEYTDISLENTPKGESEEGKEAKSSDESSEAAETSSEEHLERLDKNSQERSDAAKEAGKAGKQEGTEVSESGKDSESDSSKAGEEKSGEAREREELDREAIANLLEIGSLELEPSIDRNPLLERSIRTLLKLALDPTQTGMSSLEKLNQVGWSLNRYNSPTLKSLYQESLSVHGKEHPAIKDWIRQISAVMKKQDLNSSYQDLYRSRKSLELYSKVLDLDGSIKEPRKLMALLNEVQDLVGGLAHPDSSDIALVNGFHRNLPSLVHLLLQQEYDLKQVGPNAPTKRVAKKLRDGSLNDLRLLSILSPLTDFVLNSTPSPEYMEVKTWMRDSAKSRGRDILPLQRFSDLSRAIMGQPGKTIEENLQQGSAYLPTRRRRILIPSGQGKEESERITVVLYDTSGSMAGDPGRFQAGLIAAFTAKALSDLAPSGRHRHRVVLVPFDGEPGVPVKVTNSEEAIDVIRNYQSKLANTGGSTDIQKALIQAMALIADAEKRSGEPLAAANIILMTDGEAQVDAQELMEHRKAIDRDTPLQTMFIAINGHNDDLLQFANDSQSMGFEKGFYREFTSEHIADILEEASSSKFSKEEGSFYSERGPEDIPQEAFRKLAEAEKLATQFDTEVYLGSNFLGAKEHLDKLEKLTWKDNGQEDRPLESWISKLRGFVHHPSFQDRKVIEQVVDDLIVNFESLTGVSTKDLSDFEQEQLRHLIRYAAGIEDAP